MGKLVSAIVTTYRREQDVLKRAIDSVLSQDYSNIEIIIVDDNGVGTDFNKMIKHLIKQYSNDNIKLIAHETNMGAQKARNNGISESKGNYIAFLDDDDVWLPNKISSQMNKMEETPGKLALVYCWYNEITVSAKGNSKRVIELPEYEEANTLKELIKNNYIGSNSFPLLNKDHVLSVGAYDETLPANQDYDLWIRLLRNYEIACIRQPLVNYYKYKGEKISNNPIKRYEALEKFYLKHQDLINQDSESIKNHLKNVSYTQINLARYKDGRKNLREIFKMCKTYKDFKWVTQQYLKSVILQIIKK